MKNKLHTAEMVKNFKSSLVIAVLLFATNLFADATGTLALTDNLYQAVTYYELGDEIYFEIPVKLPAENATMDLKVGDIGYWPQGSCFCLFFGKTPASTGNEPRPASEVNVVGSFTTSAETLRNVKEGAAVKIVKS